MLKDTLTSASPLHYILYTCCKHAVSRLQKHRQTDMFNADKRLFHCLARRYPLEVLVLNGSLWIFHLGVP